MLRRARREHAQGVRPLIGIDALQLVHRRLEPPRSEATIEQWSPRRVGVDGHRREQFEAPAVDGANMERMKIDEGQTGQPPE
jgi:hypothetical protein